MKAIVFVTAAALVLLGILIYARLRAATSRLHLLADRLGAGGSLPSLTVIVAARDEAASIEPTVRALLDQDYDPLQIVVVDDRSTDGTSSILDRIAAEPAARGRLEVIHNAVRPEGWLGKC